MFFNKSKSILSFNTPAKVCLYPTFDCNGHDSSYRVHKENIRLFTGTCKPVRKIVGTHTADGLKMMTMKLNFLCPLNKGQEKVKWNSFIYT